jgi:hypothetical protein
VEGKEVEEEGQTHDPLECSAEDMHTVFL